VQCDVNATPRFGDDNGASVSLFVIRPPPRKECLVNGKIVDGSSSSTY
jgi:hypothetical protein